VSDIDDDFPRQVDLSMGWMLDADSPCPGHRIAVAAAALVLVLVPTAAAADGPRFLEDVQPILVEHCGHCHGIDEASRQGGLRLDLRDAVLAGGDSGTAAVVPGKPAESELVRRIRATDPDEVMPPPHEKKPLTGGQMKTLEAWIAAGASYEPHGAFVPPAKPVVPKADHGVNPIDAFVAAHLAPRGIAPEPPADPDTLCRRLFLDLVGLPPAPEDLASFRASGYESMIDRLLASERFGEKWSRHWLDLARYSDTNGYEKDMPREMWAWRDWVIRALNADMPYDRFVIEQIAGDLLPEATQDQIVATGFLRNSMLNEEGAIIPEEFRMVEMFDRMDCIGKAVLGLTTQCAQCHSHKFDPLTQKEYFGLFAFLNDTYEARSSVFTPEQLKVLAAIHAEIAAVEEGIRRQRPTWRGEMEAWAAGVTASLPSWTPLTMEEMHSSGMLTHPTPRPDGSILMIGHRDKEIFFESVPDLTRATGLQLEALTDGDLFMNGPGRDGPWAIGRLRVQVKPPAASDWQDVTLGDTSADFSVAERLVPRPQAEVKEGAEQQGDAKHEHPPATVSIGPVSNLIDADEHSAWSADRGPLLRHQPAAAVVRFEKPLELPAGTRLRISLKWSGAKQHGEGTMLGCCRLGLTKAASPAAPPIDHGAILAARKPAAERTAADESALFTAWSKTVPEHGHLTENIKKNCRDTERASAALVMDLKERGLLDDTIVIWGGEFGRTPMVQGGNDGRDHHNRAFSMWLAGGGIKAGHVHGKTDDFGFNVVEDPVHVHDLNATLLHLLGFDHTRLTYRFHGRDYRLTDVHGNLVPGILA